MADAFSSGWAIQERRLSTSRRRASRRRPPGEDAAKTARRAGPASDRPAKTGPDKHARVRRSTCGLWAPPTARLHAVNERTAYYDVPVRIRHARPDGEGEGRAAARPRSGAARPADRRPGAGHQGGNAAAIVAAVRVSGRIYKVRLGVARPILRVAWVRCSTSRSLTSDCCALESRDELFIWASADKLLDPARRRPRRPVAIAEVPNVSVRGMSASCGGAFARTRARAKTSCSEALTRVR